MNYFWYGMNYLDALLVLPLIWGGFKGFRNGFIVEMASLLALVGCIFGAIKLSPLISDLFKRHLEWSENAIKILSILVTMILIVCLVYLVAKLVENLVKAMSLGVVNKIFGIITGMLKYLIVLSGLLFFINRFNSHYPVLNEQLIEKSILYKPVSELLPMIYPSVKEKISKET